MEQVDYVFDASWTPEKIGHHLISMEPGALAEVRNDEAIVFMKKDEPVSYVHGGPTGLLSFKITNHAAPFIPHCAETILDAARKVADKNWADYIDYTDRSWGIRWIYFKPNGVDDERTQS